MCFDVFNIFTEGSCCQYCIACMKEQNTTYLFIKSSVARNIHMLKSKSFQDYVYVIITEILFSGNVQLQRNYFLDMSVCVKCVLSMS